MARFSPGQIVITSNAADQLDQTVIDRALARHLSCDWGVVCEEDRKANDLALVAGLRLFSVYHTPPHPKFWIITEADRSATTILLPEDY